MSIDKLAKYNNEHIFGTFARCVQ